MNHFYQNIHGWFNYEELYTEMVNKFPSGSHFVEIGCWVGRSVCYLGVEIANSGKDIRLDAVDTWDGRDIPELADEAVVKNGTLYDDFMKNIEPLKHIISPIRMASVEASKFYQDESLDFVFLDANHYEEPFGQDLKHWYPKIKHGGIFAGHDADYPSISGNLKTFFDRYEIRTPNTWVHYKK